jgi:hypothetical protein
LHDVGISICSANGYRDYDRFTFTTGSRQVHIAEDSQLSSSTWARAALMREHVEERSHPHTFSKGSGAGDRRRGKVTTIHSTGAHTSSGTHVPLCTRVPLRISDIITASACPSHNNNATPVQIGVHQRPGALQCAHVPY